MKINFWWLVAVCFLVAALKLDLQLYLLLCLFGAGKLQWLFVIMLAGIICCFGFAIASMAVALTLFHEQRRRESIASEEQKMGYYGSTHWAGSAAMDNMDVAESLLVAELTMAKSEVYDINA